MRRIEVLNAADRCITLDRAASYGSAQRGFGAIAKLWGALDDARGDRPRGAADVALFMAGVKMIRAATNPDHADSWVDLAGYAAIGGELATEGGAE